MKDWKAIKESALASRRVDRRLLIVMALFGVLLIGIPGWMTIQNLRARDAANRATAESQAAVEQVAGVATSLQQVLDDQQVQILAARALQEPAKAIDLEHYLSGRISEIKDVQLYSPNLREFDPNALAANGYAVLEMLRSAEKGLNQPLQMHGSLKPPMLVDAVAVRTGDTIAGYLVVLVESEYLLSRFAPGAVSTAYISLTQNNGRQPPTVLKHIGQAKPAEDVPDRQQVGGTLFRVEMPMVLQPEFLAGSALVSFLVLGLLMLGAAGFLYRRNEQWGQEHQPARVSTELGGGAENDSATEATEAAPAAPGPVPTRQRDSEETSRLPQAKPLPRPADLEQASLQQPDPPPMHLRYDLKQRHREKGGTMEKAELTAGIFRAYDIRGVVGKTLDAGVATQVGRVLGTLALEKNAGPVVVARDGRLSGPALVEGMIKGIIESGCDVLDIGAVPTGVLYFAAHEFAAGSGVVITGSHNPPDYNGFKIMVAGDTLFGNQISAIYQRIKAGDVRSGEGKVEHRDVLKEYRQRIASDIKLERPLRVVIDCGNGIGGVCAADVLRDIGADVLPLFDEVDGTFPNHHPDPSDPENLRDLIESVRVMDADLGLALDGDADRLGVVTLGGSIVYPDRIMMLLAMDVLDRVPGATIIYDVKCTGHLAKVIEQAGGKAVMYKTGHSLIKAKMKEIGSPFAGEMSGHFFFGERWYGVDDGIYAAARLLEILANSEVPPEAILNALPTSYSTPELKVQMSEGQNHRFIDAFQAKARFDGARVTTIDGVRADFDDGWGLVRASNTTPILVVRFDGETEQALVRIKNIFRAKMLAVDPDLELPF
ncbi:MAG TPA: phosphomannomutase/phosphoglucomutase [Xanthomonadales bacterium]|nr:phosphomannomutase/phosphoglucomutase [Xanthomonadales bacterium]